ncbi:hypothetical protein EGW08_004349 [Elysia chlorotica]|uniref:L-serine ammonia-lyase n=1 Tax=Elysia chlorotica TaxID=188477 RepID=A0A433U217_ELYCH|nr:hypothetical protein EGW08_004349 [Elysia chlorotica]
MLICRFQYCSAVLFGSSIAMEQLGVVYSDVLSARDKIAPYIHETPVLTSAQADEKTGRKLFFKCENYQKTGSFKARGALNAVTHSSGNHGQALSWATQVAEFPCYVVVPQTAPEQEIEVKKRAIRGYGGRLVECGPDLQERYDTCEKLVREKELLAISSSDHADVIAGQVRDHWTLLLLLQAYIFLLFIILIYIYTFFLCFNGFVSLIVILPLFSVFLATPKGKSLEQCLRTGERPWKGPRQYLNTVADGLRLEQTGYINTPILVALAEKDVFEMGDEEIVAAMKFAFERMKMVVEPSGATPLAAAFSKKFQTMDSKLVNIGVVLSGGNVDIDHLPW